MSKFRYVSSSGQGFDLCASTIWVQSFNPLRSYAWEPILEEGGFYGFRKPRNVTSQLVLQCHTGDELTLRYLKDSLYIEFNKDVQSGVPGKFYADDYIMEGFVYGESAMEYDRRRGLCSTTIPVFSKDGAWLRDAGSMDLYSASGSITVTNPSPTPSPFVMTLHGPWTFPKLRIGGQLYDMSTSIGSGGTLVIDSRAKTCTYTSPGGVRSNVLADRNSDVFQPIPTGAVQCELRGGSGAGTLGAYHCEVQVFEERLGMPWV